VDHIAAEFIRIKGKKLCYKIHVFINSIWDKEELPEQWNEFILLHIYKKGDKTDNIGMWLSATTYRTSSNIFLPRLTPYTGEIIGNISVDIGVIYQLLMNSSGAGGKWYLSLYSAELRVGW